jgi:nucleoid-associated protein YgaU
MQTALCLRYAVALMLLVTAACASLPFREVAYREIRDAEKMLVEAQQLEAPVYAPERYLEALLTLRRAKDLMRDENYDGAVEHARKAKKAAEEACEATRQEQLRVKVQAERLLFRGEEIWKQYQKSDEKDYALETLIAIKARLDEGFQHLEKGRYMAALESAQASHLQFARLPDIIEEGKVAQLKQDHQRQTARQTAEDIIAAARRQAAGIIEQARREARTMLIETQVAAAKARQEEFERIYPSTYTVKRGETMVEIAQRREIFNDQFMWPLIYKANRDQIRDPKTVFPGQMLTIPRDLTFEDIIEARKQAEASPPYIPPYNAYNPEFYRRYFLTAPLPEQAPPGEAAAQPNAGRETGP